MPIYDYTCSVCRHLIEVIHGIHEDGPRFCPSCGAEGTMRKGFATPAVHFRGSGWAKKDRSSTPAPGASRTAKGSGTDAGGVGSDAGSTAADTGRNVVSTGSAADSGDAGA